MADRQTGRWHWGKRTTAPLLTLAITVATATAAEVYVPQSVPQELLYQEERPGFRFGPLDLYPRLGAAALYDDSIFLSKIVEESDFIWQILPGITANLGDPADPIQRSLSLDYSPSARIFTDHSNLNTIDQSARLSGRWPFSRLTLGVSQDFSMADTVVVGLPRYIEHQIYNTQLTSHYQIDDKASFEINGRQHILIYDEPGLTDSREWANDNWLNYRVRPKVQAGLGVSLGFLEVENYPDQLYERLSARAVYELTGKTDLTASAGGERREFHGSQEPATITPVFSVGATYRPTALTTLLLDAYRREQSSALVGGWNYRVTGFSLTVRQVILGRLWLTLAGGYYNLDYQPTQSRQAAFSRTDDSYFIRPGLDYFFTRRWRAGAFYQYRTNRSNQGVYEYADNQLGVQIFWMF